MQKVAAFLLERRDGSDSAEIRSRQVAELKTQIRQWLEYKGGGQEDTGEYVPEDGSVGRYQIQQASDGTDEWWMLKLQEDTVQGRQTVVAVSVTSSDDRVSTYLSMEVGWISSLVRPIEFDPRCPRVVRDLLKLPGRFFHGATLLRGRTVAAGFEGGDSLVTELLDPSRTVPVVVISHATDGLAIPNLDERIEHSLAGLANVTVVDEDAAWAITDRLGSRLSCYLGAVRVYWPHLSQDDDPYRHALWTAERIRASSSAEPVLRKLRKLVFDAASLSVIRPVAIDRIREAAEQQTREAVRIQATTADEFSAIADSYAKENDKLRAERLSLHSENEVLRTQVAKLERDCLALKTHLQAVKSGTGVETGEETNLDPNDESEIASSNQPNPGDVRFYKKIGSRPSHDVLKTTQDCGCNRWQNSHGADKARKGVIKLEGRDDWKSMQHCGSCTGGGMWRVRW